MDRTGRLIEAMIAYNTPDIKRIQHALKVYGYAKAIGSKELEQSQEQQILEAAAVLHDIGIHEAIKKYGTSNGKRQEELGPDIAKKLLLPLEYSEEEIEQICFMVGNHHSYHVDGGLILQILFEADFIVNVDEGNLPELTTKAGRQKIFKTETGSKIIDLLFQWE